MDMSVVEGEEKPINVNEVPEYAAEIHTYLREMEVRHSSAVGSLFERMCLPLYIKYDLFV